MLDDSTIKMFQHILLPVIYWEDRLSQVQDEPHKEWVTDWYDNILDRISECKGLYIYGDLGRGKSSIAAIILKAACAHGVFGMWVNFKPIVGYYKNESKHMFNSTTSMIEQMTLTPLLVIDELAIKPKDWWPLEVMEEVVRNRVQRCRPTIITSNHSPNYFTDGLNKFASADQKKIAGFSDGLVSIFQESVTLSLVTGYSYREKEKNDS